MLRGGALGVSLAFFRTEAGVLVPDPLLNGPVRRPVFVLLGSDDFVMFSLTTQFLRTLVCYGMAPAGPKFEVNFSY
jgi:hypothetical protein